MGRSAQLNKRAFTLTELVVCLGVLSVLAALLLPALNRAKRKAQQAVCMSNLRQHGFALAQFVGDKHSYPVGDRMDFWQGVYGDEFRRSWSDPSRSIFVCPRSRSRDNYRGTFSSYGYNSAGIRGTRLDTPLGLGGGSAVSFMILVPAVKDLDVADPAKMIALGDAMAGWKGTIIGEMGWLGRRADVMPGNLRTTKEARRQHDDRANLVFCDGHGEALDLQRLFESRDEEDLRLWNRDGQAHLDRL